MNEQEWNESRAIDTESAYAVVGYRFFNNGHDDMIEVWGTCRADGQYVRYFQRFAFFELRLALCRADHPDAPQVELWQRAASRALAQSREAWPHGGGA